jgi:hypothetical protein
MRMRIQIRDPGWKKFVSGIRDKHPGCATLVCFTGARHRTCAVPLYRYRYRTVICSYSHHAQHPIKIFRIRIHFARIRIQPFYIRADTDPNTAFANHKFNILVHFS